MDGQPLDEVIVIAERASEEIKVIKNWRKENNWDWSGIKFIETDGIPTLYDAWNQGILISEGEYLTNINTDDPATSL